MNQRANVNGPTQFSDSHDRIVLNHLCRIGDRVVMAVPNSDEGWATRRVRNGVEGTIIGIHRYQRTQSRVGIYTTPPGLYEYNGSPIVKWDDGQFDRPSLHDVILIGELLNADRHERAGQKEYREAFETPQFISDLPDLPFYEWDIVTPVRGSKFNDGWSPSNKFRILDIKYDDLKSFCDDGVTPLASLVIEPVEGRSGTTYARIDEFKLSSRGNIYWWYHDKSMMKFSSIEEECALHMTLGMTTEVRCPETGHYGWPLESVLPGVTSGIIDGIKAHDGFFGSGVSMHGHLFKDRDVGERVRAKSIEGFSNKG